VGLFHSAGVGSLQPVHAGLEGPVHHSEQRMGCPMDAAGGWMHRSDGRRPQRQLAERRWA